MGRLHLLLPVVTIAIVASCTFFTRSYRPPRAPVEEAAKARLHWGAPRETLGLSGSWLRAVTMALDDFLPAEAAENARAKGAEWPCLARRDSYDVEAWAWSPQVAGEAGDGGVLDADGGTRLEADAGVPGAPDIIYVSINLLPDACDFGESPLVDGGATYAIDTVNWRILAVHH